VAELIAHNLAPIMFAALVIFLLLGYPVAFSLAANGLLFFIIAVELAPYAPNSITLSWPFIQALPDRVFQVMSNEVLLAVPFFTFMGLILERSGMAEDLLETIGQLFGTIRGGLAYAVVFVGALLAATTGVVAASVISMGLISLPIMLRYGYDRRLASGVIAASGTLAQIIPPSLVLIVMADQLGRSVGDMYEGAFLPGLILAGLYAGYVFLMTVIYPKSAPGLPVEAIGYREPDGARGVWQLGVLVLFSGAVGYYVMSQTAVRAGADFVILTICVSTVVALICAVISRFVGANRILISAALPLLLVGALIYLRRSGSKDTSTELVLEMLAAAALYAFLLALIERTTGLRLMSRMATQVTFVMVPPLLLIFLVLGTIFIGLATPTEGGAMGALGALILAAGKRRLDRNPARFNFTMVKQAVEATAKLSAFVIFILIGARVFSLTFYGVNGHIWVEHLLTSLPGGQLGFLLLVNTLVFVLAFFLDFFELAFIIIPLLGPSPRSSAST
jgi:TRAP-type mannitol/chloroaromatic compound transport system permease large subunit